MLEHVESEKQKCFRECQQRIMENEANMNKRLQEQADQFAAYDRDQESNILNYVKDVKH